MRDFNWRKAKTENIQQKRIKKWSQYGWSISKDKHRGMMKKTHFGCGCQQCKPWKHKLDHDMKPSDRRKVCRKEKQ